MRDNVHKSAVANSVLKLIKTIWICNVFIAHHLEKILIPTISLPCVVIVVLWILFLHLERFFICIVIVLGMNRPLLYMNL